MIITVRFSDGTVERKDSDYVCRRADGVVCSLRLEQVTGATILEPCEVLRSLAMYDREEPCTDHQWHYTGSIPCTGPIKCYLCGIQK